MINYFSVGRSPAEGEFKFSLLPQKKVPYFQRKFKELKDLNVTVAKVAQPPL
jgi:hypothetical protein